VPGVVGGADRALLRSPPGGLTSVRLVELFGTAGPRAETTRLITEATAVALARFCP
jgi:hypothetical protein